MSNIDGSSVEKGIDSAGTSPQEVNSLTRLETYLGRGGEFSLAFEESLNLKKAEQEKQRTAAEEQLRERVKATVSEIGGDQAKLEKFYSLVRGHVGNRDHASDRVEHFSVARPGGDLAEASYWRSVRGREDLIVAFCRQD